MITPQQFEELVDFLASGDFDGGKDALLRELATRWPTLTAGELKLANGQADVVVKERHQVSQARMDFAKQAIALHQRYPGVSTFGECVKLGAADGDEFALYVASNPQLLEMTIPISD